MGIVLLSCTKSFAVGKMIDIGGGRKLKRSEGTSIDSRQGGQQFGKKTMISVGEHFLKHS